MFIGSLQLMGDRRHSKVSDRINPIIEVACGYAGWIIGLPLVASHIVK